MADQNQQQPNPTPQTQNPNPAETLANEGNTLLAWEPLEYEQQERSENWYIAGGIIAAILIAGGIVLRNYLMAVTFFLLALVVYLLAERKPQRQQFEIKEFGIKLNGRFIPYRDIRSYWIIYRPGEIKAIAFDSTSTILTEIQVLLDNTDPNDVRAILQDRIPEDLNRQESQIDQIARRLKI